MSGGHRVRFAAYDIGGFPRPYRPYAASSTPAVVLHRRSFDICGGCLESWPCREMRHHGPKPHPPIKRGKR